MGSSLAFLASGFCVQCVRSDRVLRDIFFASQTLERTRACASLYNILASRARWSSAECKSLELGADTRAGRAKRRGRHLFEQLAALLAVPFELLGLSAPARVVGTPGSLASRRCASSPGGRAWK